MRLYILAFACITALMIEGCDDSSGSGASCVIDEHYEPDLSMHEFSPNLTHPLWLPGGQGTKFIYDGGGEHIVVEIKATETIDGVTVRAVQDTVTATDGGALIEDTTDFYAQDEDGNVWYFGEDTAEYENGEVVSTAGTWRAGVDGGKPGIVMFAADLLPPAGVPYRQEYLACEAEDFASVVETDESVTVNSIEYEHCVRTREFTPLEPDALEDKINCPDVGLVKVIDAVAHEDLETLTQKLPPPI